MKLALLSIGKYDGYAPPLGLASIATYLEKYLDFKNTSIIDATYENIQDKLRTLKPDLVGISAKTIEYNGAIRTAKEIKRDLDIPVLIGGVHISTLPSSMKDCFDIGVIGEAEETMLELMKHYGTVEDFSNIQHIKGLVYFKDKKLTHTEKRELITPLDRIPYPDKKYIHKKYFDKRILPDNNYGRMFPIFGARGCPYRCVFCSTSHFWNKTRFNSVEYIKEEVNELISKYKIDYIPIWDDLFAVNKERLREIANTFENDGLNNKIKLSCQVRANLINDELCLLLKKIGVNLVAFGFESGSERMVRYLKRETVGVEDNKKAVLLCKRHGLKVTGSVMFGSPTETIEDMKKTLDFIDFLIREDAYKISSFVLTPFPATDMWMVAKERGKVSDDMNWDILSINHQQMNNPLLLDDNISKEEFKKIFLEGRKKLEYFRWKVFQDNLKRHPLRVLKKVIVSPGRILKIINHKHIAK